MSGFVLLYRTVYENPVFKDAIEASVFVWMFAMASWQPSRVRYKERVIDLERGQLAVSVRDLSRKFGWGKSSGHDFLEKLKKADMVRTESRTGVTVVTICKYDEYQINPFDNRTPAGQQSGQCPDSARTQNKEGNKGNEGKDSVRRARELDEHWRPDERAYEQGVSEGYSRSEVEWLADGFRNHWRAKQERRKDWSATFRNWLKSAYSHRDVDQRRKSLASQHGTGGSGAQGMVAAIRSVTARLQPESQDTGADSVPSGGRPPGGSASLPGAIPFAGGPAHDLAGADRNDALAFEGERGGSADRGNAGGVVHVAAFRLSG